MYAEGVGEAVQNFWKVMKHLHVGKCHPLLVSAWPRWRCSGLFTSSPFLQSYESRFCTFCSTFVAKLTALATTSANCYPGGRCCWWPVEPFYGASCL